MSGFGPAANPPYFTITSSASVSNVIDGGGKGLAGLIFPKAGWTGTAFAIKEGNGPSTLAVVYDSSAAAVAITTPASGSAAILVRLEPIKYHTMQHMQLVATSAQSSAIIVQPVWADAY